MSRLILVPNDRAAQDEAAPPAVPKGLSIGDEVGCNVLRDLHLCEARSSEQPEEFVGVGKAKHFVAPGGC